MNQDPQSTIKVKGEPLLKLPADLFIPPQALEVFLGSFEGPLDLLLYLIRKQNIDILDIPIAAITAQYMEYVELMRNIHLDLAADYLLMAALLAQIKSRLLLPRQVSKDAEEEADPRAVLIAQLQQYEQFTKAAQSLDERPRLERELFLTQTDYQRYVVVENLPQATLDQLAVAFRTVMERARQNAGLQIKAEGLSVRAAMVHILARLAPGKRLLFDDLFNANEGREGVVVSFIALLELARDGLLELIQNDNFSPIHVRVAS